MTDFICAYCKTEVPLSNFDLAPKRTPEKHFCPSCKQPNMLSRKTLFLSLGPSLVLMLLGVALFRAWLPDSLWAIVGILAAYVIGVAPGIWLARRYGKLVTPPQPLL